MKNWKVRASSMGKIISKSGKLTQGVQTYLTEKWVDHKRGIHKEIASKYFKKGNLTEQDGIAMLQRTLYPDRFLRKNTERKSNDYTEGTADLIAPDGVVYDIKNAWDWHTFGRAELKWEYEWQLKAYLWMWGGTHGRLFYTLNNMPDELMEDEERKLFYAGKFPSHEDPDFDKAKEELREKYIYDKWPDVERFKIWDVELTDGDAETMVAAVDRAREYLQQLEDENDVLIENNRKYIANARG